MTHSVSTIECSQLVPSTSTLKFNAILDQQVKDWMTYLATDYERLNVKTTKLHWLVMEMRLQMGGTYAPSYSPHGPDEDSPPPPPPVPLF